MTTPSFVLVVLCYITKLVAPIALVYLDYIVIRLYIKVLDLKNNAASVHLLCYYYTTKVHDYNCVLA